MKNQKFYHVKLKIQPFHHNTSIRYKTYFSEGLIEAKNEEAAKEVALTHYANYHKEEVAKSDQIARFETTIFRIKKLRTEFLWREANLKNV